MSALGMGRRGLHRWASWLSWAQSRVLVGQRAPTRLKECGRSCIAFNFQSACRNILKRVTYKDRKLLQCRDVMWSGVHLERTWHIAQRKIRYAVCCSVYFQVLATRTSLTVGAVSLLHLHPPPRSTCCSQLCSKSDQRRFAKRSLRVD